MKRLKVWHRIAILFLVLLAVNIISLGIVSTDKNLAIKTIDKERDGIVYLEPLRQLRQLLPQYRRVAESNPKLLDPKANAPLVVNLDKSMTRLDDLDRKLEHELTTTEDFVGLKGDWKALQKAISSPEQLRKAYDKVNTRVRALVALAGDSSGLILDNVLESYYLINVVVVDLPNEDDLLNNLLDSGNQDANQLLIKTEGLKRSLSDTNSHLEVAMHADADLASLDNEKREHQMRLQALLAYLAGTGAKASPAEYASMVQAALDENFKLYDLVAPTLDAVLQKRGAALQADKSGTIELIFLLSLTGLALTIWIGWSIVGPIKHAIEMLESPGGEHVMMVSTNRDEVSQLIRAATMRKPSAAAAEGAAESPNEALLRENQELKELIVELTLENRAFKKSKSVEA